MEELLLKNSGHITSEFNGVNELIIGIEGTQMTQTKRLYSSVALTRKPLNTLANLLN